MTAKLTILSLGWGVQSWTLAAMVALGELPSIDAAIHADTTWEMSGTYEFAAQWTPWLEERGMIVLTVGDPKAHGQIKDEWEGTFIPAYTITDDFLGNARPGMIRRQCTGRWKIRPMRREVAGMLEKMNLKKTPGVVDQWIGISLDEHARAKPSDVKYISSVFPLVDLKMTRADCVGWLQKHDLPVPPKSACTFCPYHSTRAWKAPKRGGDDDWAQAVDVDRRIRDQRPPYPLYVHPARIPLEQADIFGCTSGHCFL